MSNQSKRTIAQALAFAPNAAVLASAAQTLAGEYPHHPREYLTNVLRELVQQDVVTMSEDGKSFAVSKPIEFAKTCTMLATTEPKLDAIADPVVRALHRERWIERQTSLSMFNAKPSTAEDASAELDAMQPLPANATEDERIERSIRRDALLRAAAGLGEADPTQGGL